MILEILIAQYNETEEIIKPMLDSIALQQGIDFNDINVIIANDGSDIILSNNFLNQYHYHIDYYIKPHSGLSSTRNFLLDHSSADYLMFCDADDMFLYNHALNLIFSEIEKGEFDCIFPHFMVEAKTAEGKTIFKPFYECHVHGKVIRRQYLIDKKIRWKDDLIKHDSRYFFTLCQSCTMPDRLRYWKEPYYLWKYNANSLTRSTGKWVLETYSLFTYSVICLIEELLRRGLINVAKVTATSYFYYTYFIYNSENWQNEENSIYVKNALKSFYPVYKKYKSITELNTPEELQTYIQNARNDIAARETKTFIEKITFSDWIKLVEEINKEGSNEITNINSTIQ